MVWLLMALQSKTSLCWRKFDCRTHWKKLKRKVYQTTKALSKYTSSAWVDSTIKLPKTPDLCCFWIITPPPPPLQFHVHNYRKKVCSLFFKCWTSCTYPSYMLPKAFACCRMLWLVAFTQYFHYVQIHMASCWALEYGSKKFPQFFQILPCLPRYVYRSLHNLWTCFKKSVSKNLNREVIQTRLFTLGGN